MYIRSNNINDFCLLIESCYRNEFQNIKIFISEHEVSKDVTEFIYVLFTPLYTAIYSDTISTYEYNKIYKTLETCQNSACEHNIYIQEFDNIEFDKDSHTLIVGKQTNVI